MMTKKRDLTAVMGESVQGDLPVTKKATIKKEEKEKKGDIELYYVKDNEIRITSLYTKNKEEFFEWVQFVDPTILYNGTRYEEALKTSTYKRKEFVKRVLDGFSIWTALFRPASKGYLKPITYDGKGN